MSDYPEPALEPPADVIIGHCTLCGGEIYEKEPYWDYDGKKLCEDHLDFAMAKLFGCQKKDGQE